MKMQETLRCKFTVVTAVNDLVRESKLRFSDLELKDCLRKGLSKKIDVRSQEEGDLSIEHCRQEGVHHSENAFDYGEGGGFKINWLLNCLSIGYLIV